MSAVVSTAPQDLHEQIEEVRSRIERLKGKLRAVETELEKLAAERERQQLLENICLSLEKLDEQGAAHLFWGERGPARDTAAHVARVRAAMASFAEKIAEIEQRRKTLEDDIQKQLATFDLLSDELLEQQERAENEKYEFVVSRDLVLPPYVPPVMPWSEPPADRRRYRKTLLLALLIALLFGSLVGLWTLPLPEKANEQEIPERLVELVQRTRPTPPPPRPVEQKKPEKQEEKPKEKTEEKPKPTAEPQKARAKAEKSGILAFKNSFAALIDDTASQNLGADAQVKQGGEKAVRDARRNLVVAQAREGSGGINTAAISRNVGGLGDKVGGVAFTRVQSSVGNLQGEDRPLSDSPGPSRTDEEIQIVFDRYKAALYRIYNRELRVDPTLRGKMVLRITIEPSGEVSFCVIESTDLASAALKTEVVARVKRFNFGPKEGVPKITILYPIDFLPAT
ncbi:MAG TPA: AgmX/PglI C-terminal domain-containing protein [Candidatus Polarisedimenticolia bacterium]|nr:AgmX/PglI C-terminal domain-containing protein [Candidatus Polarisedimenticolia bacterium]